MKRRTFLLHSSLLTTGFTFIHSIPSLAKNVLIHASTRDVYQVFKNPDSVYRPFVRWWWNGDKIERTELVRELKLLKDAGIGGVEINPIAFPPRTDDLGKISLPWLSPEWIELLEFTFAEAKSLGLTCDLIVGSGWPFGGRFLEGEERSQIMVVGTKKIEGPLDYETSLFDLLKEADPAISSPYARRQMEIISVSLVPYQFNHMEQVRDLSDQVSSGYIHFNIPKGTYVLYALVKIQDFMEVINGAPGANGPVLNHYNAAAVRKYLDHMSGTIQNKTGSLSKHIRALFADSLELEGANWTADMADEFKKRKGYDLMPLLPFLLFKIGSLGNVFDYNYGAEPGPDMKNMIQRVRYDFESTKAELLKERFVNTFIEWCKHNKIKSRAQAYGRGYFPLEGSFDIDIPECETWLNYGIGKEMSETDYRIGRAYTMVNKYVSSAAHLKGKKLISCEELTNIYMVFNETLEIMKITSDQSMISGVTHTVLHGFNYSPPDAPFPGWVRYGSFINEKNIWWPYLKYFTDYKARLSALFQQGEMFADIAILNPDPDTWSVYGAQNEPFPSLTYPPYQSFIWESIHQHGNGCDYVSEHVIQNAEMKDGYLFYGSRKYHSIFLTAIQSLQPATAQKLHEFVAHGGKIFCIGTYPYKSLGWLDHEQRDKEVRDWVDKMKTYPDRFVLIKKPEKDFIQWYSEIQSTHKITPYVRIHEPNPFISQVRYQLGETEILFFINSNADVSYEITITPSMDIIKNKYPWKWDPETGERYRLDIAHDMIINLGPADSMLMVFDNNKRGKVLDPKPLNKNEIHITNDWSVEWKHVDGSGRKVQMNVLKDLKDIPEWRAFAGEIIYTNQVNITDKNEIGYLDLGKVFGVSALAINGKSLGSRWFGRRIYQVKDYITNGKNNLEIRVFTSLGNYMKSLPDNPVAQFWTNEKKNNQPVQSMGLIGPVRFC